MGWLREGGGRGGVWYNKDNMTSHNGQHCKPAAHILAGLSNYCKFQHVMDVGCLCVSGEVGVVRYNKANMISQDGAAQILHCPSDYCRYQLVVNSWRPGVSSAGGGGGEVVWSNKTNITSHHGQHS